MKGLAFLVFIVICSVMGVCCIQTDNQDKLNPTDLSLNASNATTSVTPVYPPTPVPTPLSPYLTSYREGLDLSDSEEFEAAIDDFNASIDLNGTHGDAYLARGDAYYGMGRDLFYQLKGEAEFKAAIEDYNRALNYSTEPGSIYTRRGWSNLWIAWLAREKHFLYGRYAFPYAEAAIDDFTQALAEDPDSVDALNGRALAYALVGRGTREAEYGYNERKLTLGHTDAQTALKISPENAWTHYAIGIVREAEQGPFELSALDYTTAIGYDPSEPLFYLARGQARQELTRYISPDDPDDPDNPDDPDDPEDDDDPYDLITEDYDTAIDLNEQFAMAYTEEGTVLNNWKITSDNRKTFALGLESMQDAIDINPEVAQFHFNHAFVQLISIPPYSRPDLESVLLNLDKAVELDPDYLDAHFFRWYVLRALNRDAEAQEEARIFKTLAETNEELELALIMEEWGSPHAHNDWLPLLQFNVLQRIR
jgi:tetratricopeptide (TPR) repeat protein